MYEFINVAHWALATCPSRGTLARETGFQCDARRSVDARLREALINDELLGGRHRDFGLVEAIAAEAGSHLG